MAKALKIAIELLSALSKGDVLESIRLTDDLKKVMDTFKVAC